MNPDLHADLGQRKRVFRVLPVIQDADPLSAWRAPARDLDQAPIFLSAAMRHAVDTWIAACADPKPNRSEAVRRLLETGLAR